MTRFLVFGGHGLLGSDVVAALAGRDVRAPARADVDITSAESVAREVRAGDVVINAAAYTAVDAAETDEAAAFAVNAEGPRVLAEAARAAGARLVHISTDYVFRGDSSTPYPEDAPRDPLNAYGRSKAAGEEAVLAAHPEGSWVLRTAWLYGSAGASFPATIVRLLAERETLDVVDDQHGQPTWSRDLAERIVSVVDRGAPPGIYHATNSGTTTWYGFARAVARAAGLDENRIRPTTSDRFPRPAARPAWSVLGQERWSAAGMTPMRDWESALAAAAAGGVLSPR